MKKLITLLFSFCLFFLISCKKDIQKITEFRANLTIVNGVADRDGFRMKFSDKTRFFDTEFKSYYFNNGYFDSEESIGMAINTSVPITIVDYIDTTKILYNASKIFRAGDLYTLYISGKDSQIDTTMVAEKSLPYHDSNDSVMSIRFVNLAPESEGISVNLTGQSQGTEVNNLQYRGITLFKIYPAKLKDERYTFEFHNSITGELLGMYEFQPNDPNYRVPRFKTLSLIFKGLNDWGFRIVRVDY